MDPPIQIDKHIPIPPKGGQTSAKGYTAALKACKVGHSFAMPFNCNRTGLYVMAQHLNMRITIRKQHEPLGYRVWRVE